VRVVDIPQQRNRPKSDISFSMIGFLAMVINCTAGMDQKSQKMEVVVTASERYIWVCET
jgi:hypothetical protein